MPVTPETTAAALPVTPPDPHQRQLHELALALTDGSGFRLAIATFEDAGIRDAVIDRLAEDLAADGVTLTRLDVSPRGQRDQPEPRDTFALLDALRDHHARLTAAGTSAAIAVSVVGLEHFISEFSATGLNVLTTANLQRELFPRACPLPVVLWLPPWATTLLAQTAPDLWHWRTATFDFPGGAGPPSALSAWPPITRDGEGWRPVDDDRLRDLTDELEALRQAEATDVSPRSRAYAARLRLRLADAHYRRGAWDQALSLLRDASHAFATLGDVRSRAVTMGNIADVLQARGQPDEALRLLRDEVAPVFERLGDVWSRAVTMGKIADVLQARGQLDEALRIHREEQLPVYERLGDVRERAVTMGKIADILRARGQLDEAIRILREEVAPVFERLGDVRSRAMTMGRIADILRARGQPDEALRIHREEQLPVYERLGDVRERAVTMGKIADILQARGQLDEALRILRDEVAPAFERLSAVRERAMTMGLIADILKDRGRLDEALRLLRDEVAPVFERLGDVRSRAVTMGKIADILKARGRLDDALRLFRDEVAPVFERLGDVQQRAVTMGRFADVLQARGQLDEALRIRREEELPVYERLGDVRSRAVTMGKIADLLEARGQLDEALRIHAKECLPVARTMKDADGIAHGLFCCARIRLQRGGVTQEEVQTVADELGESFAIARHLGHAVAIGQIGETYGQFLAKTGEPQAALEVLDAAAAAFATLQDPGAVSRIRALQDQIRAAPPSAPAT